MNESASAGRHLTFSHVFQLGILIYFVILGWIYASSIPLFESSDEAEHFLFMHNLLLDRQLPIIQSAQDINGSIPPIKRWNNESHQPPLYYAIGAILIARTDRSHIADYLDPNQILFIADIQKANPQKWYHPPNLPADQTPSAVMILRGFNILLGLISLIFVQRTSYRLFKNQRIALSVMLFAASIPTFIVISASISNDALLVTLFSAGIYLLVDALQKQTISNKHIIAFSVILALLSLTKITGLSFFALILLTALLLRGNISSRHFFLSLIVPLIATALIGGWWYLRNLQVYGDPLAFAAVQSVYGRELDNITQDFATEVLRVWNSFWFMVGYRHEPVYAASGYYIYATVISMVGCMGFIVHLWQERFNIPHRRSLFLLIAAFAVIAFMLIYGTRNVDISYGRLLLPAVIPFAIIVMIGLWTVLRYFSVLLLIPMMLIAILAPSLYIDDAYPRLIPIEQIPDSARYLDWQAEGLSIIAVDEITSIIHPAKNLYFDIFIKGNHPANPALLVTAVDPITQEALGDILVYPGMARTDTLDENQIYQTFIRLPLNDNINPRRPRQILIDIRWFSPRKAIGITFSDAVNNKTIIASTLITPDYAPQKPDTATSISFDHQLELLGYSLSASTLKPGGNLELDFLWQATEIMSEDFTLTVQLINANDELVAQTDGMVDFYPTSMWQINQPFTDTRTLEIPADLAAGDYSLRIGWYRTSDFSRLPIVSQPDNASSLFTLPETIIIE